MADVIHEPRSIAIIGAGVAGIGTAFHIAICHTRLGFGVPLSQACKHCVPCSKCHKSRPCPFLFEVQPSLVESFLAIVGWFLGAGLGSRIRHVSTRKFRGR